MLILDCDVVPMQACSLLLGRLWQYDKNTTHHGRSSKYSFIHKDKKVSLILTSPEEIIKDDLDRVVHERKERGEFYPQNREREPPAQIERKE
jgi:hypothetical protein